jgi:hypothetical protein
MDESLFEELSKTLELTQKALAETTAKCDQLTQENASLHTRLAELKNVAERMAIEDADNAEWANHAVKHLEKYSEPVVAAAAAAAATPKTPPPQRRKSTRRKSEYTLWDVHRSLGEREFMAWAQQNGLPATMEDIEQSGPFNYFIFKNMSQNPWYLSFISDDVIEDAFKAKHSPPLPEKIVWYPIMADCFAGKDYSKIMNFDTEIQPTYENDAAMLAASCVINSTRLKGLLLLKPSYSLTIQKDGTRVVSRN